MSVGTETVGVGLTVMVYCCVVPVQLLAEGLTETVAVTGFGVVFTAVKDAILPVPLAASPIVGSLFVHEKVVPGTAPVNAAAGTVPPLQTAILDGTTTVGIGFTVTLTVSVPMHPSPLVMVTLYKVVVVAEHTGLGTTELFSPVDGVQEKLTPPVACKGTEFPLQRLTLLPASGTNGEMYIITGTLYVPGQERK